MKLFLDVASKYLTDQYTFYKKRANFMMILSILCWVLTILTGYLAWLFGILHLVFAVFVLALTSFFLTIITNDFYTKSSVYNRVYEDLEEIRKLANKEADKSANKGIV